MRVKSTLNQTSGGQKFATPQNVKLEEKDEPDTFLLYACGPPRARNFNVGAILISVLQTFVRRTPLKTRSGNSSNIEFGGVGVTFAT